MTFQQNLAVELERQKKFKDEGYVEEGLYIFDLRSADGFSETIPLVINPESEVLSEPFTVNATPTLDGGLFVEENGIIARRMTLTGTTGMRPVDNTKRGQTGGKARFPTGVEFSHGRDIYDGMGALRGAVSGQMHFRSIQDRIFRNYADLKRNPVTAPSTRLFLHITRDREHWRVIPESFTMRRSARTRVLYYYQIDLLIVGKADIDTGLAKVTADKEVRRMLESNVQENAVVWLIFLESFIKDMGIVEEAGVEALDFAKPGLWKKLERQASGIIGSIQSFLRDNVITRFIQDVQRVVAAALQFVNGVTNIIVVAFDVVTSIVTTLDNIIESLSNIVNDVKAAVLAAFRRLSFAFHGLMALPWAFVPSPIGGPQDFRRFLNPPENPVDRGLARDVAQSPPGSVEEFGALGTGPTPGTDRRNTQGVRSSGPEQLTNLYSSTRCYTITAGDSLPAIAASQLGDPTRWWEIAQLNGLQAPYVSDLGLPMTAQVGECILVPSDENPPEINGTYATLGVLRSAEIELQILGTDYELREVSGTLRKPRFDWVVDHTKNDFTPVAGVPNLQQGIRTRLNEVLGDHPLYPNLGTEPSIGRPNSVVDRALATVRITRSVEDDPRILTAQRLTLDRSGADIVGVEFDAVVRQLQDRRTIQVAL